MIQALTFIIHFKLEKDCLSDPMSKNYSLKNKSNKEKI